MTRLDAGRVARCLLGGLRAERGRLDVLDSPLTQS